MCILSTGSGALDCNEGPWYRLQLQESALGLGMKTAYSNICDQFDQATAHDPDGKLDKDMFHGDPSFAGLTRTGFIKYGSLTN